MSTPDPASVSPRRKSWFLRHKLLSAVPVLLVVAAFGNGGGDLDPAASTTTVTPVAPSPSTPGVPTYGDGAYEVGVDIPVGTYRSSADTHTCYWATLRGFGGDLDDIVEHGSRSPVVVELTGRLAGFETQGCGDWTPVRR